MTWIKNAVVDLAVTILVVLTVAADQRWAWWILVVYTPLMLLLKVAAVTRRTPPAGIKVRSSEGPAWIYHVLYAANVILLSIGREWWLAAGWVAIWVLSYLQHRKA